MKIWPLLTIFCLSALLTQPCFAVENDDEIIVTAKRHAMQTKDYAGSVSVLDQERLETVWSVHPAEALNEVTGVNMHRNSGQEHLTAIRSPVLTGGAGAGSFLYLEDGVPLRAAGFSNVNGLFESAFELADRVEVTKGPGSVLYGSNAVHGLINILSRAPANKREFSLDSFASDSGVIGMKTSFNGSALSGRYRVAANFAHDSGFRENSGFDQQKLQFRHDLDANDWSVKTLATFINLNQETAGFITGIDAYNDKALARTNPNPEAFRDGKSARVAAHFNKVIDENTNLSLIPYARWTDMSFRRHFVPGKALEDSGHKSMGLLASYSGNSNLGQFTLGFDSEYTNGFLHEVQPGPGAFSFIHGEHFDYRVKGIVLSPYAQTHFALGPNTNINIGARGDYTHYDYHNNIDSGQFGRFIRVEDRQDSYFIISPKMGVTHNLSDTITAYGRLARGVRAPQVTDAYSLQLNQRAGEIKAETLDLLELGLKASLAKLNLEVAVFAMDKNNFFFRNANGFNVVNGRTNHVGIEFSFNAPLNDKVDIIGGLTLANHRYDFDNIVGSASSTIRDGSQVDTAPKTLGQLQIRAKPTDAAMLSLKWQYMGDYYLDPGNTAKYSGHNIFTLRGTYELNRKVTLYGRIDNLFDTAYADRADFAFGSYRYFPGRPRTVFLGIRFTE